MMAVHSSVGKCYLFVLTLVLFDSSQALASSCQVVHPSEYAYKSNSVTRSEEGEANCRRYPQFSEDGGTHYTHCDGTQLRLTDSELGSEQYTSGDYYVWNDRSSSSRLLFIFPTRVNLTTITLHYFSDSDNARGLPRLRYFAVPDNFEVWDALLASHSYVEIAAVPPGGEPAGLRNVSVKFNFMNVKKILMYKFSSSILLAVSEVEFFTQCKDSEYSYPVTKKSTLTTTTSNSNSYYNFTTTKAMLHSETKPPLHQPQLATTGANTFNQDQYNNMYNSSSCHHDGDTALAWALFGVVTVLFIVSLTVNVIIVALWVYKKREVKGQTDRPSEFEIEGNPCYEATQMKQTTETETHVYGTVQGKRGK